MSAHRLAIDLLLAITAGSAVLGAIGMWRMATPMQALHYLALPASIGTAALTLAVFFELGMTVAAFKMLLVAAFLFGINAVVTHATGRAFHVRETGNWHDTEDAASPAFESEGSR